MIECSRKSFFLLDFCIKWQNLLGATLIRHGSANMPTKKNYSNQNQLNNNKEHNIMMRLINEK